MKINKITRNRLKPFKPVSTQNPTNENENEYWNQLKIGNVLKLHGPVKHIAVSPVEPYMYAVPDSFEVILYRNKSDLPIRKFANFKSQPQCCSFRSDGQLLAAGNEEGVIKVYPTSNKSELRSIKAHRGAIHGVEFLSDNTSLCSVGKDSAMIVWDIATGGSLHKFTDASNEQLRSLSVSKSSPNIVVTGCFNGQAKLYDLRMNSVVRKFEHGFPVSCVSLGPCDSILSSAGDSWVKLWSLSGSDSKLCAFERHHKLVTALSFACGGDRLLSGGMDGLVKITNTLNYMEVAKFEFQSPLLSLAVTPDSRTIIVGCEDGLLHTKRFKEKTIADSEVESQPLTMGKELTSLSKSVHDEDTKSKIIERNERDKKMKLCEHKISTYLRKFKHSNALDLAVQSEIVSYNPEITLTLIRELARRRALAAAVAGKSSKELNFVMNFIIRYLHQPCFTASAYQLAVTMLDVYSVEELHRVPLFQKLLIQVRNCVKLRKQTEYLSSLINTLVNNDS